MKYCITVLFILSCLTLAAGTFVPLSNLDQSQMPDFSISLKWGSLLNLGNCVYEDDLWYHGGFNDAAIRMPQLELRKALNPMTRIGLQAFLLTRDEHEATMLAISVKRLVLDTKSKSISFSPTFVYSKSRFSPFYESAEPYWGQPPHAARQDSWAYSAQLPLILAFKDIGVNCSATFGYSQFSADAKYKVSGNYPDLVMQNISYGPYDILSFSVNANYPMNLGRLKIIPELGYSVFTLVKHEDDLRGSLTGGISIALNWPQD